MDWTIIKTSKNGVRAPISSSENVINSDPALAAADTEAPLTEWPEKILTSMPANFAQPVGYSS